ncbi:MAG: glycosyltransferase family 9 protein [Saprospiraceae bacterium]
MLLYSLQKKLQLAKKILIIRFSSIGDIVLTSPVIRCLKLQTGAEIHYLTKIPFATILETNPHISKVYAIQKGIGEVIAELKKEKYDYIIDLHHNLRTFLIKCRLPFVKNYAFKKLNFEKWLLTNFKINRLPTMHIVDRYLETVKPLGVKNDGEGLDFFLNPDLLNLQDLVNLKPIPKNYIALPIGAGRKTKALTIEKIVHVCQKINYPVVLLGGKQEIKKANYIATIIEATEGKENLVNLVGQCSLLASAAIVKNAKVVLTGDTGLMHIAAAFQKPIISIWGNTVPEFGMYPYYPTGMDLNRTIEVKALPCRPCSKIGYDDCPKGHFKCIEQLSVMEIIAQLKNFIGD